METVAIAAVDKRVKRLCSSAAAAIAVVGVSLHATHIFHSPPFS